MPDHSADERDAILRRHGLDVADPRAASMNSPPRGGRDRGQITSAISRAFQVFRATSVAGRATSSVVKGRQASKSACLRRKSWPAVCRCNPRHCRQRNWAR